MAEGPHFEGCVFNFAETMNFNGTVGNGDTYQKSEQTESAEKNNSASGDRNSGEAAGGDCCACGDDLDPLQQVQPAQVRHCCDYYFDWDKNVEQFCNKISESKTAKEIIAVALVEFWEIKLSQMQNGEIILREDRFLNYVIEVAKEAKCIKNNRGLTPKNLLKHIDNIIIRKINSKDRKK